MYALLYILGIAACAYLLIGSIMVFRKQQKKKTTLDKEVSLTTVRHPIISNPIFILFVAIPVITIIIAMIWIFSTQ
jgi:predicted permease